MNSHDGRAALAFRLALYRPVCTNGLIVCDATLPAWKVPHRGNVFDAAISAVVMQAERFAEVGTWVERMERTMLDAPQQLAFAAQALALRFPTDRHAGVELQQVLEARRAEDVGDDVWRVYNRVQESVIHGDLIRRTASHRVVRSRPITAIRRDVQLNTALWRMATALAA